MADPNEVVFPGRMIEIPHAFEVDLNRVVVLSHRFALEGIDRAENDDIRPWEQELAHGDDKTVSCAISQIQRDCEELRNAANQLALVGVVTRLGHWIAGFVKELPGRPSKTSDSLLISQLQFLNDSLGCGPVPLSFFENLVDVRDSITHADSQATWPYQGKDREIAPCYRNPFGRVELSEEQLQEAVNKFIEQVSWYTEKLHPQGELGLSSGT